MLKYGIKLWTINKNRFEEAVDLFNKKQIDFIELYIVPYSFEQKELEIFKKNITIIHSPHHKHNFDVFNLDKEKRAIFKNQIIKTADFLNSKNIVLHAGIGRSVKLLEKNLKSIYDKRIIIENMPKVGLNNDICFGYSIEQLKFFKKSFDLSICFDIGHAIKSAISQKIDYKEYLRDAINELKPWYFHICGGNLNNEKDEHLNLWEGGFDLKWIKNLLLKTVLKKNAYLVFEVPKNKNNLKNDIKNIAYFKKL